MNKREEVTFLFIIVKEVQISFTSPVIFFTLTDYAENIFTTMNNIHNALLKDEPPDKFAEIVNSLHMEWLQAVQDVEMFSKRINNTPREVILNALDYTMNCIELRYNHILEYIDKMHSPMTEEEEQLLRENLTTINEMQHTVNSALLEKLQYIRSQADQAEYLTRIHDETEELLDWLDILEDSLAIELCKVLNFKVPLTRSSLAKTLKQIVDEVAQDNTPEAQRISEVSHVSNLISSSSRLDDIHEIEIEKITHKIKSLESRINRLRAETSPELMALKHKTIFLKYRLQSLENIRTSMNRLKNDSWEQNSVENLDDHGPITSMIFNHLLPHQDRCRLVENLKLLWKNALTDNRRDHESIIDIFSAVNLGEQLYSDEIGIFSVDKFGRKIYRKDTDDILNDRNKLVPLNDDEKHVYFYDLCGRYYLDNSRHRVYKNHDGADEYILDKNGLLVKVREEKEGVVYFFDRLGRYYTNAEGKHIYRHDGSPDEYEIDSLDNLVRIHRNLSIMHHVQADRLLWKKTNTSKERSATL